jgi:hypothetical protein
MDADYANRLQWFRQFKEHINIMVNNKAVFFITSDFQNDR